MADVVANFSLNDDDSINADFELNDNENIDALFVINGGGATWGNIEGDISDQNDLQQALNAKANITYVDSIQGALNDQINALDSIVSDNYSDLNDKIEFNAGNISSLDSIISSYGDIVAYNASDFADSAQGALANSALQPGDNISELINNAGYITASSLAGYATESWVENKGYITGIDSTDVVSALGYTPYDATNPSGFISGITSGDVTTALGYTPYDGSTNPNGYITSSDLPIVNDGKLAIQVNSVDVGEFTANQATATTVDISVPTDTSDLTNGAGFLINNATGTNAFAVGNLSQSTAEGGVAVGYGARANSTYSTAVGQETRATNTNTTVIGRAAKATEARAIAIGSGSEANAQDAIAIKGINNTANTFQVYTYNMLDMSTGLIPDARISTNIARVSDMQTADNGLQAQIDAIVASSDVFDIVGTYADLQAYDISTVPVNDIIKVLVDSTHNDAATYYRCTESGGVKSWTYIGAEGAYYTKAESNSRFVAQTTTVNGHALSSNVTLTASDVGALPDTTVIPTVNNSSVEFQINGAGFDTITLNQSSNDTINITVPTDTSDLTNGAGYITAASIPTDYYTKAEINALIPQPTKVPVVYYQPTNSYCYDSSNNRFYGSNVYEMLYLVKPKTSGTTQVIDMTDTFSLSFTIDYISAPSSAITVAEIMVSYAAGKGVLLQLNSTGLYYRNNITGTTITGTRALTAGNSYDVKVEYDGTHMIISYKLSSDVNYTQANSTTCTCSGSNYNYAAVGMDVNYGNIALSSVTLTNGGNTLYSYTAGQITLDYDSSLTLNGSNQLKVVVDQTYNSASTNPQSGVAIAGAGFLTGITSGDVITALGYTPYNSSNPSGYTSNVGTVTSVNNTSPDGNGNVTLSIPAAQVNSDWNANSGVAEILNKPTLATVATSGLYSDLSGTPTIPTVYNSTITFTQGGVNKGSITLNQSGNDTIALDAGGGSSTDVQINGTSITVGGVANILTNTAYNSSTNKIATMSDVPSLSGYLQNTATGSYSLTLLGQATSQSDCINIGRLSDITNSGANTATESIAIGYSAQVIPLNGSLNSAIAIGDGAGASASSTIAIGHGAQASGLSAIQLGNGSNSTADSFQVGSYQLLNTSSGYIPNARLNLDTLPASGSGNAITSGATYTALSNKEDVSNKVTTISGSSTDTQYPSAKCIYDNFGDYIPSNYSSNVIIVGSLVDTNNILSGFSNSNYAKLPMDFPSALSSGDWEFVIPFKTTSLSATQYVMCSDDYGIGFAINSSGQLLWYISGNATSWNVASATTSTLTVSANTQYYFKLGKSSGTTFLAVSTDKVNYTTYLSTSTSYTLHNTRLKFGVSRSNVNPITNGVIDLKDSYINVNGVRWWSGVNPIPAKALVDMLKIIYPVGSLYITSSNDVTCPLASLFGTWTLIAKDKALWTGDGTNGNDTIAAGLPDISGVLNFGNYDTNLGLGNAATVSGGFAKISNGTTKLLAATNGTATSYSLQFKASDSNSIYGNSPTVQPPAYVVNVWRRTA